MCEEGTHHNRALHRARHNMRGSGPGGKRRRPKRRHDGRAALHGIWPDAWGASMRHLHRKLTDRALHGNVERAAWVECWFLGTDPEGGRFTLSLWPELLKGDREFVGTLTDVQLDWIRAHGDGETFRLYANEQNLCEWSGGHIRCHITPELLR